MTVATSGTGEASQATEEPTAEVPVAEDAAPAPRRSRTVLKRGAARGLVLLVLFAIAVYVVEGPLATQWYQVRQHHLSAKFQLARPVHNGDSVAVLQIPAQHVNVTVVQGSGPGLLRDGPAHRSDTPPPGSLGNSIIFGHRNGWGSPFRNLGKLKVGDNIFVQPRTRNGPGSAYFYRVTSVRQVSAGDVRPYATSNDFRLTLVTGSGSGRLVVSAVSGDVGHLNAPTGSTTASTGPEDPSLEWPVLGLIGAGLGLAAMLLVRRRRAGSTVGLVIAVPLVLAMMLCLTLIGDTLLRSSLA